ncbi:MAG: hypothetical protein AAF558_14250 [Verrucomicrobiota bacterium]
MNDTQIQLDRIHLFVAWFTGVSFFLFGLYVLPKWPLMEIQYRVANILALTAGPGLIVSHYLTQPSLKFLRPLCRVLLIGAAFYPFDALGFFLMMRIPIGLKDLVVFGPPFFGLTAYFLFPIFAFIYRKVHS